MFHILSLLDTSFPTIVPVKLVFALTPSSLTHQITKPLGKEEKKNMCVWYNRKHFRFHNKHTKKVSKRYVEKVN